MTLRLTFGIDPGLTGAIAVFGDGEPLSVADMPTRRVGDWGEIDALMLSRIIRAVRAEHAGAYVSACIEKVGARPGDGGTSAFRFGDGVGRICGVLETLGVPYSRAIPAVWKRKFGLIGSEKDAARTLAITRFPTMAPHLTRKKDHGRADALWLALYHEQTEQRGARAA